jgi:hexosaminidase
MIENLKNAAVNGKKYGAAGFLNTDWGDHGHWQYQPVSYGSYIYGAALSWNVDNNINMDIAACLDKFIFMDSAGVIGKSLLKMGDYYLVEPQIYKKCTDVFLMLCKDLSDNELIGQKTNTEFVFRPTIEYIESARKDIEAADMRCSDSLIVYKEIRNAIKMILHGAKLGRLKLALDTCSKEDLKTLLAEMISDMTGIISNHMELWLERNRPGGLLDSIKTLYNLRMQYEELYESLVLSATNL